MYKYLYKDEIIKVWLTKFYKKEVLVQTKSNIYTRGVSKDKKGREFFTIKDKNDKIYLKDWIKITMTDFKYKIENKQFVTLEDLMVAMTIDEIEDFKFMVPMNVLYHANFYFLDQFEYTECKIDPKTLSQFKITPTSRFKLITTDPNTNLVNNRELSIMDFFTMLVSGVIKII